MRYTSLIIGLLISTLAFAATPLKEVWTPYADRIQAVIDAVPDHPTDAQIEAAKADAKAIGEEFAKEWTGKELSITGYARTKKGPTWQVEYLLRCESVRTYTQELLETRTSPREIADFKSKRGIGGKSRVAAPVVASRRPFPVRGIVGGDEVRKPEHAGEGSKTDMVGVAQMIFGTAFIERDTAGTIATGEIKNMREVVGYPTIRITIKP